MLKIFRFILSLMGIILLVSCAPQTRYVWHNYDTALYSHYSDPAQIEQYYRTMQSIVLVAEAEKKVPPGIYAEYGYVLYELGCNTDSIQYFHKESDQWPESRVLMAKMITNAQNRFKKQGDKAKPAQIVEERNNSWTSEGYK